MKNMKKNIIAILVVIVLTVTFWANDVISDRKHEITILKPITLFEQPPQDYPKTNKETGKINPGEHVKVLRMGYGKDFRTWKVEGSTGQEGWFTEENDSIKVTDRRNR